MSTKKSILRGELGVNKAGEISISMNSKSKLPLSMNRPNILLAKSQPCNKYSNSLSNNLTSKERNRQKK